MRLHKGDHVTLLAVASVKAAPCVRVAPKIDHRLPHADAVCIGTLKPGRIELADHRAAANQRRREAHALFIAKPDYLQRVRQTLTLTMQLTHAGNCRQDTEQAVVLASVAHAVLMRPGHHHRRERHARLVTANDVAQRIEAGGHASIAHQADQIFTRLLVLFREVGARDLGRVFAERRQHVGLFENVASEFHGWLYSGVLVEAACSDLVKHWMGDAGGRGKPLLHWVRVHRAPVPCDVDAACHPHAVVLFNVVEKALQALQSRRFAEQPAVHADAHHLG